MFDTTVFLSRTAEEAVSDRTVFYLLEPDLVCTMGSSFLLPGDVFSVAVLVITSEEDNGIPLLQMRTLRQREMAWLIHRHTEEVQPCDLPLDS